MGKWETAGTEVGGRVGTQTCVDEDEVSACADGARADDGTSTCVGL